MSTRNGRPRVFVSSTIYDFRDLRSALKLWLEELGYDAQLSEYNDFEKRLDTDSYSACLSAIENADYFLLLIGSRVGGAYNRGQGVSITRQEYREARKQFRATGRPKLVVFVRKEVWIVREDRKALEEFLALDDRKQRERSAAVDPRRWMMTMLPRRLRRMTADHPSKFVSQAEHIFSFIDEVRRAGEMARASQSGEGFPEGNWVHVFDGFDGIAEALRSELRVHGSLRRASLVTNLRQELLVNGQNLLGKSSTGTIHPQCDYLREVRPLLSAEPLGTSPIPEGALERIAAFVIVAGRVGSRLATRILDEAIVSGEFLEWSNEAHTFQVGELQATLLRLREEIDLTRRAEESLQPGAMGARWLDMQAFQALQDARGSKRQILVENTALAAPFALHDRHRNILALCRAIMRCFDGIQASLASIPLQPRVLFSSRADDNPHELTLQEVGDWMRGGSASR